MVLLEQKLCDGQEVQLVNSSTQQAAPFTFRAHKVPPQELAKLEADPALEAFNFEILKHHAPVALATAGPSYLRILPDRSVDGKGAEDQWATFIIESHDAAGVALRALGHGMDQPAYLAASGDHIAAALSSDDFASRWFFQAGCVDARVDSFNLTEEQYSAFARDGFVILEDILRPDLVHDALMFINNRIGIASAWVVDTDVMTRPGEKPRMKLPPSSHPSVMQLVNQTCIGDAAERLLGSQRAIAPSCGELALLFPVRFKDRKDPEQFSIDGTGKEDLPCSLLCKVALSDQKSPLGGSFAIFPGSHRKPEMIRWYLDQIGKNLADTPERPKVGDPVEIRLSLGDAILMHPLVCRLIGTNRSRHVRYSVVFRFRSCGLVTDILNGDMPTSDQMLDFPCSLHSSRYGTGNGDGCQQGKEKQQRTSV